MYIPFGVFSAAGAGGETNSYELISTSVLSTTAADFTFSSIPSGYKHLQVRAVWRSNGAVSANAVYARLNGDATSSYASHRLEGDGAGVYSLAFANGTLGYCAYAPGASATANAFGSMVFDLLDYTSTSKNKTWRSFSGTAAPNFVSLISGVWTNTAAVNSIYFLHGTGSWIAGTRFSLYGIKG